MYSSLSNANAAFISSCVGCLGAISRCAGSRSKMRSRSTSTVMMKVSAKKPLSTVGTATSYHCRRNQMPS